MASLEIASRDHNKKEKNLKVFVRDRFNSFHAFRVDDSRSNEDLKSKEVLECSSRSSVFKTGESLQIPSLNHNPTSSPQETNSNQFYNPGQPENSSSNDFIMGASSLVQIWEARSSSSSLSQSLTDSRTSSGLSLSDISNSSAFSEFLNDVARKNNESSGEEIDWCPQFDRNYVTDSNEKEREGRCFLELATSTPRIRGRQASEDVCKMILRDRENELEWLVDRYAVSKFSPRGCGRLQYMLRIRSLERCIAIQERYRSNVYRSSRGSSVMNRRDRYKTNTEKGSRGNLNTAVETKSLSRPLSFRVKKVCKMASKTGDENVLQETMVTSNTRENQEGAYKPEIANKPVLSGAASNKNGSKKPEIERKATKEGEGLRKAIMKESEETNKSSLDIAEKVNFLDSKEIANRRRRTMGKAIDEGRAARRVIDVKTIERKERRNKEEVSIFEEGKCMEIEEYRINPQETESHVFRESGKEEKPSQNDEETSKAEEQEASETLCLILESPTFLNDWEGNDMEYEENENYNGESMYYDWISDISRPRSYWEELKKQRELEFRNKYSEKDYMWNLIKRRTVSRFLAGDFRNKIDKIMSRVQKRLEVERNLVEEEEDMEESLVECSARYQENLEENETEKETPMICDLRQQIKKLQREMLELQSLVKSCVDFQKSMEFESLSVSDFLERNCSVCFEMPIDSLLYRCGHMCTCMKCAHELQWSSGKCPICMAPIVDVVRAFLDS